MRNLFIKELRELLSSLIGGIIGLLFIVSVFLFVWVLPGSMNMFESGYSSLDGFASVLYNLLFITLPLWSMNSYANELRYGTIDWLRSLPISETTRFVSKFFAAIVGFGLLIFISFCVYLPVFLLVDSPLDIDLGVVITSYFGIILLASYALSINLFVSSKISNPIVSVVVSIFSNFVLFYGIKMTSDYVSTDWLLDLLSYFDVSVYYDNWMRGVVDSRSVVFFVSFVLLMMLLRSDRLFEREHLSRSLITIGILITLHIFNLFFFIRFDCTQERLYSVSSQTKSLIQSIDHPIRATLYLGGTLNPGFRKLEKSVLDLLLEYQTVSKIFDLRQVDPSSIEDFESSQLYKNWLKQGLPGVAVKETTTDGSFRQKMVYPYIELSDGKKTMTINILNNDPAKSGAENLNTSIEQLEFAVTDGLARLMQKEIKKIAFIEGHGEWDEPYLNGTLDLLSAYYTIDRGALGDDFEPLRPYSALIIADPKAALSPQDIFVLDQYIRQGGSIFFNVSPADIRSAGAQTTTEWTASIRDLGLSEMFFQYGIRLQSNIITDVQCSPIPLKLGEGSDIEMAPWYYSPLFRPYSGIDFLSNISNIELPFCSSIELLKRKNDRFSVKPLLHSSSLSQEHPLPHSISLRHVAMEANASNFPKSGLISAVLVEGFLPSLYANRLSPIDHRPIAGDSDAQAAKVVVVANSELFKNRITQTPEGALQSYPLGFNPYLHEPSGNADFVLNTVKYLCGDELYTGLIRKQFRLRMLSKSKIEERQTMVIVLALGIPTLLLAALSISVALRRKRKNERI